ncbi:MAG: prepilin-type N-terminal cleavage/methylation domain-containing protein [Gemmatimonadaceae bacterium]
MRTRRGFTLFEATAALAIVGITAVAALGAVGAELRTTARARRAIEAQALATSRLDFMALLSNQELQALPDTVAKGAFAAPLNDYTWKATSSALSATQGLYGVDLTINWPNGAYVVRTYMYRLPPLAAAR